MTDTVHQLAKRILDNIKELIDKWKQFGLDYNSFPEYPDYGVEEQELLIKQNILLQLNIIKDYVDCDEIIKRMKKSFDTTLEDYKHKYEEDEPEVMNHLFEILKI